jgi:hypothetical protein
MASQQSRVTEDGFFLNLLLRGELKSDNYLICVRHENVLAQSVPIMVINPVIPPGGQAATARGAPAEISGQTLRLSKSSFGKRELVQVSVDSVDKDAYSFVSVSRVDALSLYADSLFAEWASREYPATLPEQQVTGRVVDASGNGVANALVTAALLSDPSEIGYGVSGPYGDVNIQFPLHYDDRPLATEVKGGNGLRFLRNESQERITLGIGLPPLHLSSRFEKAISERLINTEVSNKLNLGDAMELVLDDVDTVDFYGVPDRRYMLDNYVRFPDMKEILVEFVPDVRVRKLVGQTALQVSNLPYKTFFDLPALVLLDGVPVNDIDQLLALDPLKISSIDVVAQKFILGDLQIPGIVHYKTYKTDMAGYELPSDVILYDHPGLWLPRVPVFKAPSDERMPYMANLLYWHWPQKTLSSFSFPTSDAEGSYRVKVVTVNAGGIRNTNTAEISVK